MINQVVDQDLHPALQPNPLSLILTLANNRTVTVAWNDAISEDCIFFAEPTHPETSALALNLM